MFPQLKNVPAQEVLAWAFETYGDRVALSTAFGPSGVVLMHLASQVRPGARVFFIDTGFHFDETLEMLDRIDGRLNVDIEVIRPRLSVEEQAEKFGEQLYVIQPDSCCAMRKVEPTARMLSGLDAWVTALRRDQGPTRARLQAVEEKSIDGRDLVKVNPMVHWTKAEIWRHILEHDLPYNPLHDQGYPSIGCAPCTQPATNPNDERSGRWAGHQKKECGLHTML